jgi:hypothetical protein
MFAIGEYSLVDSCKVTTCALTGHTTIFVVVPPLQNPSLLNGRWSEDFVKHNRKKDLRMSELDFSLCRKKSITPFLVLDVQISNKCSLLDFTPCQRSQITVISFVCNDLEFIRF